MAPCTPFRALALSLLVSTFALPSPARAQNAQLNVITAVTVRGGTVEIQGSRRPHFTTFSMTDPSRLVIDVSDAVFSGVAPELRVGNGIISSIRTASYGSDASAIARVVVGFVKDDAETDFKSVGNRIIVSVMGAEPAAPAVALSPPAGPDAGTDVTDGTAGATGPGRAPATQAEAARQREADARADREAQQKATEAARAEREAQVAAAAEAERAARADREAQERAAKLAAEAEADAQAQARLEAERLRREAQAESQRQAAARAASEAEAKRRAEAEARVRAEEAARLAKAQAAAAQKAQEQRDLERARAEALRREEARAEAARAREAADAQKAREVAEAQRAREAQQAREQEAKQAREAIAAQEAREAIAAQEAREAEARRTREAAAATQAAEARRQQEAARVAEQQAREADAARAAREAAAEQARRGQATRPRPTSAPAATSPSRGGPEDARPSTVAMVGFRQQRGVDRVFVRTHAPVAWRISEESATTVVLELEQTDIGARSNTLPLQTGFFDTAVASVRASQGPGRSVTVRIQLDQVVPYRVSQEGNVVSVDFGGSAN